MKVYGKCSNCNFENSYATNAHTRVEFAMQDGETIKLNCANCGANTEIHVDKLVAKPSKIAQIIALSLFVIGTPLLFFLINPIFSGSRNHYVIYIIGGFMLIPVLAYAIINRQDQTRVSDFNRRKLKGRVHNVT